MGPTSARWKKGHLFMAKNVQAKHSGSIEKEQESQRKDNLFRALLHLPPRTWSLLEIVVLVILTNHAAVTDLMQLLKVIKS
jgi:hypothetical protein